MYQLNNLDLKYNFSDLEVLLWNAIAEHSQTRENFARRFVEVLFQSEYFDDTPNYDALKEALGNIGITIFRDEDQIEVIKGALNNLGYTMIEKGKEQQTEHKTIYCKFEMQIRYTFRGIVHECVIIDTPHVYPINYMIDSINAHYDKLDSIGIKYLNYNLNDDTSEIFIEKLVKDGVVVYDNPSECMTYQELVDKYYPL
jgi:hypothetical protein